jgi:hypothetical protein
MTSGTVLRKQTAVRRKAPQSFELARSAGLMLALGQMMSAGAGASMSEAPWSSLLLPLWARTMACADKRPARSVSLAAAREQKENRKGTP